VATAAVCKLRLLGEEPVSGVTGAWHEASSSPEATLSAHPPAAPLGTHRYQERSRAALHIRPFQRTGGNTMANPEDAVIKLLYAVDDNTFFTADTVKAGEAFDLIANIEIGEDLNEVVDQLDLFVGVTNLTRSDLVTTKQLTQQLQPADDTTVNREVRVDIDPGWTNAQEGDVLQAVATLKITAGIKTDYSNATSNAFTVVV
jgi:hypothetical protein